MYTKIHMYVDIDGLIPLSSIYTILFVCCECLYGGRVLMRKASIQNEKLEK